MNIIRTINLSIALILTLILLSACSRSDKQTNITDAPIDLQSGLELTGEMQVVASDNNVDFCVNPSTGEFEINETKDNFSFKSNPMDVDNDSFSKIANKNIIKSQLILKYADFETSIMGEENSYVSCTMQNTITVFKADKGCIVVYNFKNIDISVPIKYQLNKGSLEVEVLLSQIKENSFKIISLQLLPYFLSGGIKDNGYIFVPDGSGSIINFNNNKNDCIPFSVPIYGNDISAVKSNISLDTPKIMLPVYGINLNKNGIFAIIEKGAEDAKINAFVSKKISGYNNVFSEFKIRNYDQVSVKQNGGLGLVSGNTFLIFDKKKQRLENIKLKFFLLPQNKCDYSAMANIYRNYLIENKNITPKSSSEPFLYLDIKSNIQIYENILGFKNVKAQPSVTSQKLTNMINELCKTTGRNNIKVEIDIWNDDDIKGNVNKGFHPIDTKLTETLQYLKNENIETFLSSEITSFYKRNYSIFTESIVSKSLDNSPVNFIESSIINKNDENLIKYMISPEKLNDKVNSYIKAIKKVNAGLALDDIGSVLYSNLGEGIYREQCKEFMVDALSSIRGNRKIASSRSLEFVLPYANIITDLENSSSNYDISDYAVPFYQMVVGGLIDYTSEPLNISSNYQESFLKALEYGSNFSYCLLNDQNNIVGKSIDDKLYSCDFDKWKERIKESFEIAKDFYNKVGSKRVIKHSRIDDNIFLSEYENGKKVIFNYNDTSCRVMGIDVEPNNFNIMQ